MMKKLTALTALFLSLLLLSSCTAVAVTVGGVEIDEDTYRYVYMKNKEQLFGKEETGSAPTGEKKEKLDEAVKKELSLYAAEELLAKEYGIELSDKAEELIDEKIKETEESFESKDEYRKALGERYMTEDVFYDQTRSYYLGGELFNYMTDEASGIILLDDKQLFDDIENEFCAAIQVYLPEKSDRARLEEIREKIIGDGTRSEEELKKIFLEAAAIYSKDSEREVRYFARGEMVKEFEDVAFNTEYGKVSEVFESELGVHLLLRVKITDSDIEKNYDDLRYTDLVRIYNAMLEEKAKSLEFVVKKEFTE